MAREDNYPHEVSLGLELDDIPTHMILDNGKIVSPADKDKEEEISVQDEPFSTYESPGPDQPSQDTSTLPKRRDSGRSASHWAETWVGQKRI
jgi:hypothetical protein